MSNELLTTQLKKPTIYAYSDTRYEGKLKVGYTAVKSAEERVKEQFPVITPTQSWTIVLDEPAIRDDGSFFTDHDVHRTLKKHGIERDAGEWFDCDIKAVQAALMEIRTGKPNIEHRTQSFKMRPEQQEAVERTAQYFTNIKQDEAYRNKEPHFLWNAKMRFGKTFTAYQLAKKMGWKKILILTFKPAVHNAWQEDLENHIDFEGWQFVSNNENTLSYEEADKDKPIVCFGSFQDYLGKNKATGGIKTKNEWVHATKWDCVIFDEYHYGAWRETAKDLFDNDEAKGEQEYALSSDLKNFDEELLPITTEHYLYLSGTPFRALNSGEFIEEQIYNWTYSDEQKAKEEWQDKHPDEPNPYASLPKMVMMTYQLPDAVKTIAQQGEFNEFDLNEFFFAEGTGNDAKFKHEEYVQKWLDLMRNALPDAYVDSLKLGRQKPPMPFSDVNLLGNLLHTFWFLPSVASCDAMENLLKQRQNVFYQDYQIVNASGTKAGIGSEAIPPVKRAMGKNPLASKSITLSCGKLTTGVSIAPWTGILMLRNMTSPEGYFQAAFRVQTPWVMRGHNPNDPNNEEIIKELCYVFDFAPTRALRQISDYSCRLNVGEQSPERKVEDFIQFLPVLAYDGSSMRQIDAAGVLDIAMQGTTATLLAKRWESALLVNVDNFTLQRFLDDENAMKTLQKIEGFRSINKDIETIINRSNEVKERKKDQNGGELSKDEKKEISDKEKEMKGLREQIQKKLIKFATRIPIFMYLTDYREHTLHDVITQLEPQLFERVTGLTQADFRLLVNLNLFNESLMNDAVYKFKRYEDASTSYHTMDWERHETVFLYNTEVSRELLEKN